MILIVVTVLFAVVLTSPWPGKLSLRDWAALAGLGFLILAACAPALADTYTFDQCMAEMPYRVAEAQKDPTRYCQCAIKHPYDEGRWCAPNTPRSGPGWHMTPDGKAVVFDPQ